MEQPEPLQASYYPVLHSIIDGAALCDIVRKDFGRSSIGPSYLIQSGLNDHYELDCGADRYVIRVYRHGWRTVDDIIWELDFTEHLAAAGAPVAAAVRRLDGGWLSPIPAPEGERHLAVFRRAPGLYTHFGKVSQHRISPAACAEQFGRSVAEVHAAADSFRASTPRFQLDLEALITEPLSAIARVYAHRGSELAQLQQLAADLRHLLAAHNLGQLDWGPCHGDMTGGNSTYHQGRVIHFDFDCGGPGWRAYELGVFLWSMSSNAEGAEVWDQFLTGYHARRSLGPADLAAIPAFACARAIWLAGLWCANAHVFGYHKLHDDYLDHHLRQIAHFYNQAARSI